MVKKIANSKANTKPKTNIGNVLKDLEGLRSEESKPKPKEEIKESSDTKDNNIKKDEQSRKEEKNIEKPEVKKESKKESFKSKTKNQSGFERYLEKSDLYDKEAITSMAIPSTLNKKTKAIAHAAGITQLNFMINILDGFIEDHQEEIRELILKKNKELF
jgi:hypothetical protein